MKIKVVVSINSHAPLWGSGPFHPLHPHQLIGYNTFLTDPWSNFARPQPQGQSLWDICWTWNVVLDIYHLQYAALCARLILIQSWAMCIYFDLLANALDWADLEFYMISWSAYATLKAPCLQLGIDYLWGFASCTFHVTLLLTVLCCRCISFTVLFAPNGPTASDPANSSCKDQHAHPSCSLQDCNESAYWFDGVRVCGVKSSLRQPLCKKEYVGIFAGKQTLVKKIDFQSAHVWRVPCSMPIIWPLIPLHLPYTSNSSGELCPQALASQDSDCISALTNPPSRASFCTNFSHFIHCKKIYNP